MAVVLWVAGGYALGASGWAAPAADSEGFPQQEQAKAVVMQLHEALIHQRWSEVASLFSADFRGGHEAQVRDGSLFAFQGKSVNALFSFPGGLTTRASVRGDHAWVEVGLVPSVGGQIGTAALELVWEEAAWRIAAYPPTSETLDAARADVDGEAAGRWVQAMLADGKLDAHEQILVAAVLPAYSGLVSTRHSAKSPKAPPVTEWQPATQDGLARLAAGLNGPDRLSLSRLTFFPKPTPETAQASAALAKRAIAAIFDDLHAAALRFPELAHFDRKHATIQQTVSDTRLWYSPNGPERKDKIPRPIVGVGFSVPHPHDWAQIEFPQTIYPRQNLAVWRAISVKDRKLARFIEETVKRHLVPLRDRERALGGEPMG